MRHALRWLLVLWLALLAPIGCSNTTQSGQLLLAIETDMAVPKDLDEVVVEVTTPTGHATFERTLDGTPNKTLPGTFAIVGPDPNVVFSLRIIGQKNGHPRVMREVSSSLPADGVRVLRVSLQWLCNPYVSEAVDGGATSACRTSETCVTGSCVPIGFVNPSSLSEITQSPYGADAGVACFDPLGCFNAPHEAKPAGSSCFFEQPDGVDLTSDAAMFNVAIKLAADSYGFCSGGQCLIPLDFDPSGSAGWYAEGHRIIVPHAVCDDGASVVWSTACARKATVVQVCQPHSPDVQPDAGTLDADASTLDDGPVDSDVRDATVDTRGGDALDATPDRSIDATDDRVSPPEAGRDAGDAGVDAPPDVAPEAAPDVSVVPEAGTDAPLPPVEAGADASDAGVDVSDGSVAPVIDAPAEAAPPDVDVIPEAAPAPDADADLDVSIDVNVDALDLDGGVIDASVPDL